MTTVEPIRKIESIKKLEKYFAKHSPRDLLLFTIGTNCGLRISDIVALNVGDVRNKSHIQIIEKELSGLNCHYYNNFSTNPKKDEVNNAIKQLDQNFDIIVAVGGGSVLDFAKAYRYYSKSDKKLIAIPTTAGTGAESTQFAVIYNDGIKYSIDEKSVLPDYAIADSQLVDNNPKYLKACTAMDAYCHAIESYWAVASTQESRDYAKQAIELCRDNIIKYVNSNNEISSDNMMLAAHLAGKAINISRTTAAHALSYKITSEYNIPHGHAVALSIADLLFANSKIDLNSCDLPSLVETTKIRIDSILAMLEVQTPEEFKEYWFYLMKKLDLEYDLKLLGIKNRNLIINSVNLERLKNNPKNLTNDLKHFWYNN